MTRRTEYESLAEAQADLVLLESMQAAFHVLFLANARLSTHGRLPALRDSHSERHDILDDTYADYFEGRLNHAREAVERLDPDYATDADERDVA